ncbi:MAG: response regulator [Treponema sp.]|jgi:DNA-binding NtrC family response regulator|nr:response regulator [Treponema sp.]
MKTGRTGERRRTLIAVDGSIACLDSYREFLDEDYDLIVCKRGMDALRIIEARPIDLLITGMYLEDMTGMNLLVTKNRGVFKDIPVLMISGGTEFETEELAHIYGVQGYLRKPVRRDTLREKIQGLLREKEQ